MLKVGSKRRRTKQECREEREQEEVKKAEVAAKLASFDSLRQEMESHKARADGNQGAHEVVQDMLDKGIVHLDENGVFQYPGAGQPNANEDGAF